MFARITPYKGHALVLDASHRLQQAGIAHSIDIWGDPSVASDRPFFDRLRERVRRDALPVSFRGFHAEPTTAMRDYHCILNPSLREPFGRVPVEAFSLGVPVISHASGGPLEIYSGLDDYRHFLFRDHDGPSLEAALCSLLTRSRTDPGEEAAKLERIRSDIRRRFRIARVADETETVLKAVIANRAPASLAAWNSA
jgi:glycosyltransferase involved in cell wall biosynthesis